VKAETDFVAEFQQFEKQEVIGALISTLRAAAELPEPLVGESEIERELEPDSVSLDRHQSMVKAGQWYRFGF